ncbi:hypothetical protein ACV356_31295, partial [Pseudomonas aeruginosa]
GYRDLRALWEKEAGRNALPA